MTREVFLTESMSVYLSSGQVVRGSTTSALMPISSSIFAAPSRGGGGLKQGVGGEDTGQRGQQEAAAVHPGMVGTGQESNVGAVRATPL
jgi:hypothetical protein